jgi:hypothetical protein
VSDHQFGPSGVAPTPGDPRDPGPRPRATPRDLLWGLLTVGIAGLTALQFVALAIALVRLDTAPTTGGLLLGFLITVVWLLSIYWLVMGTWRRSVWGCPFHHTTAGPEARRCTRHAVVATTADPQGSASSHG